MFFVLSLSVQVAGKFARFFISLDFVISTIIQLLFEYNKDLALSYFRGYFQAQQSAINPFLYYAFFAWSSKDSCWLDLTP